MTTLSCLTFLLGATTWHPPAHAEGPAAIATAVQQLCAAIDRGDAAWLERALGEYTTADGVAIGVTANGNLEPLDSAAKLSVVDVDADGKAVQASDGKQAIAALASLGAGPATTHTRILSMKANCPSEHCSWAAIELERSYTRDGATTVVPMHATALARYTGGNPTMTIFAWHCSPTGPAVAAATTGKGK